uniref:THAP-type domain-containing protein n=1 Tax=Schizaphis graminum TaxID=13262 RepID=A0A2S2PG47_SCHGA
MVFKCLYCGSSSINNNKLSFHSFPKDQRKNLWLSILNLASAGQWDKICSNHFKSQDYYVHGSKKKLVYDAVPIQDVLKNKDENDSNQVQSPETPLYQSKRYLTDKYVI